MKPVTDCDVNTDFDGHFLIRLDSVSIEELIERSEGKIELIQQLDGYYEVKTTIRELQRLRSILVQNEKEFLILYKVEFHDCFNKQNKEFDIYFEKVQDS